MSLEKIEALEERITKVFEMVKHLKDENKRLDGELQTETLSRMELEEELAKLRQEKEQVKDRLEKILSGIENLTGQ
ncbi:MAG: cell division protein ZapB [Nitrospirae bacterium]|nr:cell division protein ZapB [Nitrospirota bacterium]MBI5695937.1 cell division protein ZapB [Nitrospirota bacterium]